MQRTSSMPIQLDRRVIFTLIITCFVTIGLTLLSFRNNNNGDVISSLKISFKHGILYTGENIRFTIGERNFPGQSLIWHFSDSLNETENGTSVFHAFKKPGIIKISILVDGKYSKDTIINIQQQLPMPGLMAKVSGPATAFVGQRIVFRDSTLHAVKWEWRFGETNKIDATAQNPTYTFTTTGNKRVILIVNGDIKGGTDVFVQPKIDSRSSTDHKGRVPAISGHTRPVEPPVGVPAIDTVVMKEYEEKTKTEPPPPVSEIQLEKMFRKVVEGEMHASDFKADLCNLNPDILYNSKPITLGELCIKLRDIKKLKKIKKMLVTREIDPTTNCVKSITVDIDKISFITNLITK